MYQNKKISVVLPMGGIGSRMNNSMPKQFILLGNKKIYLHTIEKFLTVDAIDEIVLAAHPSFLETVKSETSFSKKIKIVEGGKTRQESVYNGLINCSSCDIVLIHDAVRPFVSKEIIFNNIRLVLEHNAVNTCIVATDTMLESKNGQNIFAIPKRESFYRGQTPQSFTYELILKAHKKALKKGIVNATDDCSLVIEEHPIFIANGSEFNIKITTPIDMLIAMELLKMPHMYANK